MSNWIRAAEAAISRSAQPDPSVDVVSLESPPLFDSDGVRALLSPFLAGFMWAAMIFRELQADQPFDPLALLLRLLALALTLRALVLLTGLARRFRLRLSYRRYALALTDEGLLYRSPAMDVALQREDILDVRERGHWRNKGGRRFADVYVVTHPRIGRSHLALPPVFERTPGVLAERLMRWLGPRDSAALGEVPQPDSQALASKLWERVAAGETIPGVIKIPHGSAWLQRGPYASVLLGIAVLDGFIRLPAENQQQVGLTMPLVLVGALVIVPISWYLLTRAQLRPRLGLALVLAPSELLVRLRSGVQRTAWAQLAAAEIEVRAAWSILLGAHESRTLVLARKNAAEIRYHESFIGAPLEVVVALCEAYRKGAVEPPPGHAT
jgi:hypothetical protein